MAKTRRFNNATAAWFWFNENRHAPPSDNGVVQPVDILNALNRVFERNAINMDHVLVLKKYGERGSAPDPRFKEEGRDMELWFQALGFLETELVKIGLVRTANDKR